MLRALLPRLERGATVLDLGAFPGTLLRLLRQVRPDHDLRLIAAGMIQTEIFEADLRTNGIESILVNLDPQYDGCRSTPLPDEYDIALPDQSVDVVIASEIVEHLISPVHLFQASAKVLKPGGLLLITTPNQARLHDRLALLRGRSPNTALPEGILAPGDNLWRHHIRIYCMHEIEEIFRHCGFEVVHREFIDERPWNRRSLLKSVLYAIPSLRHCQMVMGRKLASPATTPA